jgi:hypothetical protein
MEVFLPPGKNQSAFDISISIDALATWKFDLQKKCLCSGINIIRSEYFDSFKITKYLVLNSPENVSRLTSPM